MARQLKRVFVVSLVAALGVGCASARTTPRGAGEDYRSRELRSFLAELCWALPTDSPQAADVLVAERARLRDARLKRLRAFLDAVADGVSFQQQMVAAGEAAGVVHDKEQGLRDAKAALDFAHTAVETAAEIVGTIDEDIAYRREQRLRQQAREQAQRCELEDARAAISRYNACVEDARLDLTDQCGKAVAETCYVLGLMSLTGVGDRQDDTVAQKFFTLACDRGHKPACAERADDPQ